MSMIFPLLFSKKKNNLWRRIKQHGFSRKIKMHTSARLCAGGAMRLTLHRNRMRCAKKGTRRTIVHRRVLLYRKKHDL